MIIDELEKILGKRPTRPRFGFARQRLRVEYIIAMWTWEEDARKHLTELLAEQSKKRAALRKAYESYVENPYKHRPHILRLTHVLSALADFFEGE